MSKPSVNISRFIWVNSIFGLVLMGTMILSLVLSVSGIHWYDLWGEPSLRQQAWDIYLGARLPRVLMGALAGMALSASGVAFQALLRNPLADPYVLGVSGGASLGGIIGLTLVGWVSSYLPFYFVMDHFVTVCAFGGALGTLFLIYGIARQTGGRLSVYSLLLAGVVFTSFTTALIMFINTMVDFQQAHEILHWLMGSVRAQNYSSLGIYSIYVMVGLTVLFLQTGRFNALSLGEEAASNLGVNVERTKRLTFVAASLLVGAIVASCGMSGFVGLVVPHIVRLMIGSDHRLLLPAATLFGGAFLVGTDCLARTLLYPSEIPVGVITALLGGPFFVYLLIRHRPTME